MKANIKKILLFIPYLILWIIYYCITSQKRFEILAGKRKGCKCIGSKTDAFGTTYYFDPSKSPEEGENITISQFFKSKGYFTKNK